MDDKLGFAIIGALLWADWSWRMNRRVARLEWALAVHSQQTGHVGAVEEILTGKVEARTPRGRAFHG